MTWVCRSSRSVSATGYLHLDRGAPAGLRVHGEAAAHAAGPVPHGDQAQMPSGFPGGVGVEPAAVVADGQDGAAPLLLQGHVDVGAAGVAQRVVERLLGDPEQGLLLGGGERADAGRGEGDAGGVGPVEDLDLGAQGGDEAVLVEGGGAQLDDGGAEFLGGLGGQRGDWCSSSLARCRSRSTRAVAAWAVRRSEKSFWLTASWSSWARRERSSAMVSSRLRS